MSDVTIHGLKMSLLESNWPKCNEIAKELSDFNSQEAKVALIEVLDKGERHHIRTAVIKALSNYNDMEVIEALIKRLSDIAYEPRIEAKIMLKELTGEDYETSKGE